MSAVASFKSETYAAFMRVGGEQRGDVSIEDGEVTISAEDSSYGHQRSGGSSKTEALLIDGPASVRAKRVPISINSGKKEKDLKTMQLVVYLAEVLPTLPTDKVRSLARELKDKFEIFCAPIDLLDVELEELEKLETLRSTQRRKFLRHVEQLQSDSRD